MQRRIYMDANATTPLLPEVVEAMRPLWIEGFGNPSSIHQRGQQARAAVDRARDAVARMLGCRGSEIVFTSGGTESDNLALFGVLEPLLPGHGRPHVVPPHLVTSAIEHHAVLHAAQALERRGVEVTYLKPNRDGLIEPASLQAAIRPHTRLVSIMLANNETGVVQPVAELAATAHSAGALFHTDAVQAAAKLPLDLSPGGALGHVDLLSISGHKMYAPQGTGVLFVRRRIRLSPMFFGGSHERERRPGTENVPGIVGLGKAAEMAHAWLAESGASALGELRDRLEQGVLLGLRGSAGGVGVNGDGAARAANTVNFYFDGVDAEALVIALDLAGLAISAGSACQSGATEPSHVLLAMGLGDARARSSVRVSLSRLTRADEVEAAIELIVSAVERLRKLAHART